MNGVGRRITRDNILCVFGMLIAAHEVLLTDGTRYLVLLLAGTLMGVKLTQLADTLRRNGGAK